MSLSTSAVSFVWVGRGSRDAWPSWVEGRRLSLRRSGFHVRPSWLPRRRALVLAPRCVTGRQLGRPPKRGPNRQAAEATPPRAPRRRPTIGQRIRPTLSPPTAAPPPVGRRRKRKLPCDGGHRVGEVAPAPLPAFDLGRITLGRTRATSDVAGLERRVVAEDDPLC